MLCTTTTAQALLCGLWSVVCGLVWLHTQTAATVDILNAIKQQHV